MIARFSGALLGLIAFTITVLAGLYAGNSVSVILSRSVLALACFCFIGLILGGAAQLVVAEHERQRESQIRERYQKTPPGAEEADTDGDADQEKTPSLSA